MTEMGAFEAKSKAAAKNASAQKESEKTLIPAFVGTLKQKYSTPHYGSTPKINKIKRDDDLISQKIDAVDNEKFKMHLSSSKEQLINNVLNNPSALLLNVQIPSKQPNLIVTTLENVPQNMATFEPIEIAKPKFAKKKETYEQQLFGDKNLDKNTRIHMIYP